MEVKRLRNSFFVFLLKNFFLSILFFLFLDKYLELNFIYYFLAIILFKYLIFHKKYNKILKRYILFINLTKKYGDLSDREEEIVQKVINSYSNDIIFKEWIEGHEFLYSEKELKMMLEVWNFFNE